jgi:hypothetical protein
VLPKSETDSASNVAFSSISNSQQFPENGVSTIEVLGCRLGKVMCTCLDIESNFLTKLKFEMGVLYGIVSTS